MIWSRVSTLLRPTRKVDDCDVSNLEKAGVAVDASSSGLQDGGSKSVAAIQLDSKDDVSSTTSPQPLVRGSTAEFGWKTEDDPRNPKNWSTARKWVMTIIISLFSFCTLMTSTLVAPALPSIQKDLDIVSDVEAQLVISSFVLSYALGPFLWAPLSEQYGRFPVLQAASAWYFVWNMVCGFAHNEATMIIGRVLSGIGGAGALSVCPGVLSDCWAAKHRGRSLAVVSLVPLLAPSIGPIVGGQVAQYSTWRWAFWSTSMFSVLCQLLALLFMPETHGPTILRRVYRQDHWRGKRRSRHEQQDQQQQQHKAVIHTLLTSIYRPFHLLFTQPVIQLTAVYSGVSFGILFIIMSGYAATFEQVYGQTASTASLNYLAIAVGFTLGAQTTAFVSDRIYKRLLAVSREEGTGPTPKVRLIPFGPALGFIAAGLLMYGWTADRHAHWILPNIGMVLFAAGTQSSTQCVNAYIIDSYSGETRRHNPTNEGHRRNVGADDNSRTQGKKETAAKINGNWSASAMAGVWALKSLGGFVFPLFGPAAQTRLGFGVANTVWAVVSLVSGFAVLAALWYRKEVR